MPKSIKRFIATLLIVTLAVLISSLIFNKPVRISKASAAPHSLWALFPAQTRPDHIVLSPAGDMAESIKVSWRTSDQTAGGMVQYQQIDEDGNNVIREEIASMTVLESPELMSDNTTHCFAATLKQLRPGTAYRYRVGDKSTGRWSEYQTFTTAAKLGQPFSFVYLGDTQKIETEFGQRLAAIDRKNPATAFYMIGGDLVDDGSLRNLWDALLSGGQSVYGAKPIAAALGNHEYKGRKGAGSNIYGQYFNRLKSGADTHDQAMNYSFTYERAYFIILNSNESISGQNQWLENELLQARRADFDFIIVMFHHPPYNIKDGRSNTEVQDNWIPLFDKYNVDLVLSGHDHSYLRTKKMRGNRPVGDGDPGTTYVVATSCDKFYEMKRLEFAEMQFADVATYQVITVEQDESGVPIIKYKSFDFNNDLKDEFVIYEQVLNLAVGSGAASSGATGAENYWNQLNSTNLKHLPDNSGDQWFPPSIPNRRHKP